MTAMNRTRPCDESIDSSFNGDPDIGDLVAQFVEEMPSRVATILHHLNTWDSTLLLRDSHQLRGAAGSYGFEPLAPWAGRVEDAIRNGESEEQIRQAVLELVDACARVR